MEPLTDIVLRSLWVSGSATLLSSLWSLPLAYAMAVSRRLGLLAPIMEALVGVPTVVVGLVMYMLLSRTGPLGFLNLLYTPYAIIVGEAVLITPVIVSTAYRVIRRSVETYGELARTLGAGPLQAAALVLSQSAPGLAASVVMGFSRAIGELGVAFMVGGNIAGYTRTLTTAIALGVAMGEYELAMQLGLVLIALTLAVSLAVRASKRLWE